MQAKDYAFIPAAIFFDMVAHALFDLNKFVGLYCLGSKSFIRVQMLRI
jgi:hypothetical protein